MFCFLLDRPVARDLLAISRGVNLLIMAGDGRVGIFSFLRFAILPVDGLGEGCSEAPHRLGFAWACGDGLADLAVDGLTFFFSVCGGEGAMSLSLYTRGVERNPMHDELLVDMFAFSTTRRPPPKGLLAKVLGSWGGSTCNGAAESTLGGALGGEAR